MAQCDTRALLRGDNSEAGEVARLREQVLENPDRREVNFSFGILTMRQVGNGMQLHVEMNFRYESDLIEAYFGAKKPADDFVREYGTNTRLFPFMLFNSVEEVPILWAYQNDNGKVVERVELIITVTFVDFRRYYPFELKLLAIKVGTDGMGKTGLINIVPEVKKGTVAVPDIDLSFATKSTSDFHLDERDISQKVVCAMVIRDLKDVPVGNLAGIYTRSYTVLFFDSNPTINLISYVIIPVSLTQLCTFYSLMDLGDLMATLLAVVLALVALLFVMPHAGQITLATEIICSQIVYVIVVGCVVASMTSRGIWEVEAEDPGHYILSTDICVAVMVAVRVLWCRCKFGSLEKDIRTKFNSLVPEKSVASFTLIEDLI